MTNWEHKIFITKSSYTEEEIRSKGKIFCSLTESMKYKDFLGSAGFDVEDQIWRGEVDLLYTPDLLGGEVDAWYGDLKYEAPTEKELKIAFEQAVDNYLEQLRPKAIKIATARLEEMQELERSFTEEEYNGALQQHINWALRTLMLINEGSMNGPIHCFPQYLLKKAGVTTGTKSSGSNKEVDL